MNTSRAETQPRASIALTPQELSLMLGALYDKVVETTHYLVSYPKNDEPEVLDSCCAAHLARFRDRISQRDSLREREADMRSLIERLEALTPGSESEAKQVPLSAITLIYSDQSGQTFTQPLADITSAGTLIDPENGDDLELGAAFVQSTHD